MDRPHDGGEVASLAFQFTEEHVALLTRLVVDVHSAPKAHGSFTKHARLLMYALKVFISASILLTESLRTLIRQNPTENLRTVSATLLNLLSSGKPTMTAASVAQQLSDISFADIERELEESTPVQMSVGTQGASDIHRLFIDDIAKKLSVQRMRAGSAASAAQALLIALYLEFPELAGSPTCHSYLRFTTIIEGSSKLDPVILGARLISYVIRVTQLGNAWTCPGRCGSEEGRLCASLPSRSYTRPDTPSCTINTHRAHCRTN